MDIYESFSAVAYNQKFKNYQQDNKKLIKFYQNFVNKLQENGTTRQVLNIFIFYHFELGEIYLSQQRIANQVKRTTRSVRNAIKRLEKLGILYKKGRSFLKTCIYELDLTRIQSLIALKKLPRKKAISFSKHEEGSPPSQDDLTQGQEYFFSPQISSETSTEISTKYNYSNNYKSMSLYDKTSRKPISKTKSIRKTENKEDLDFFQETRNLLNQAKAVWEEEVEGKISFPKLTTYFIKRFLTSFQRLFENSLDKFRDFCRKVASSRFLMGEKTTFKAYFTWLIKPETYERIFSGDFDIGDRINSKGREENQQALFIQRQKEIQEQDQERLKQDIFFEVKRERNKKLKEIEENFSNEEKEELKKSFEEFTLSQDNEISRAFKETGWSMPFIDMLFDSYKHSLFFKPFDQEVQERTAMLFP